MILPHHIPLQLKELHQWVCWRYTHKADGSLTKTPLNPNAPGNASSTAESTWGSYEQCRKLAQEKFGHGIGFVFKEGGGYVGVDLDDCLDGEGLLRTPEADWVAALNSYTEVSPSGKGVKIIFKGKLPPHMPRHSWGGNGIYESGRFFTITGEVYTNIGGMRYDTITTPHPGTVTTLLDEWFPAAPEKVDFAEAPQQMSDNEVLQRLTDDVNGETFRDLFYNNWQEHFSSQSEADLSLVNRMAFYTGPCPEQLDRLFRRSRLMRDKWDETRGGETYGERTIRMALETRDEYYIVPGAGNLRVAPEKVVKEPAWKRLLVGYAGLSQHERPYLLQALYEHIYPLGKRLGDDWLDVMTLGFFSSAFPTARFENLPLNLWTLGISDQGVGKSVVSDELDKVAHGLALRQGSRLLRYTSGSSAGLIRRLAGTNSQVLAYFSEWSGFAKSMSTEHSGDMREVLMNLYDGRSIVHQLAQETVNVTDPYLLISGITTKTSFVQNGDAADAGNGFYSRLMIVAPDPKRGTRFQHRNESERQALVEKLGNHLESLPEFRAITFDTREDPPCYTEYAEYLGVRDDDSVIDLDELPTYGGDEGAPSGRLLARVKKVAALLEIMESAPQIRRGICFVREENVDKAIRLVQRSSAYGARAIGWLTRTKDEEEAQRVLRALTGKGSKSVYELIQDTYLSGQAVNRTLDLLTGAGKVGFTFNNGLKVYYTDGLT